MRLFDMDSKEDYLLDGKYKVCTPYAPLVDVIETLSSTDRPSGEWKYLHGSIGSYMTISCPFCGETFNDVTEWKYNFCPNCGARMQKGSDDTTGESL